MADKEKKLLIINFGSTSSKMAIYEDRKEIYKKAVDHCREELYGSPTVNDQYTFRKNAVLSFLAESGVEPSELSAIVARAALLGYVGGAYRINDLMIDRVMNRPVIQHAASLSIPIAYEIGEQAGVPSYTYIFDVDEMDPAAKITGFPEINRAAKGHPDNWYSVSQKVCDKLNVNINNINMIIGHLGGGITFCLYRKGKIADVIGDNELHFSPERCGGLPVAEVADLIYSGKYDKREFTKRIRGQAGLCAHLGTQDAREVEKMIAGGDEHAKIVYDAFALQLAKSIATLAVSADGKVDIIALSGGLVNSKMLMKMLENKVKFIAPIELFPGEYEMDAMALSTYNAIEGEEEIKVYDKERDAQVCL